MNHLKPFKDFEFVCKINESVEDLDKAAETIYRLVKDRPFSSKKDCIRDIVRIIRRLQ